MKTKNKLEEKKLSKAELEAREKVMKDLKKNKSALVKRYGKDAEAVMYGRATNIAKKMAESENKNRIKELVRKALMQEADIEVMADKYGEEKALGQAAMMLDALEGLLKKHDWWYMMSDDNRAYTEGSAQQYEIRKIMKELEDIGYAEDAKELFNKYAPNGPGGTSLKMKEGMDVDKDMTTQEASGHAERFAQYMSDKEGKTFTVTAGSVEGPSFDLDLDGEKYEGGSYIISKSGDIVNMALPGNPVYANITMLEGKKEDMDKDGDIDSKDYLLKRDAAIKKAKGEMKEYNMGNDEALALTFRDKNEFERAKKHFESNSDFYPEDVNDEFRSFQFKVEDQADADSTEYYLTQELEGTTDLQGYYFSMEPSSLSEDIDLGHKDNEPHMIKGDLYQIGKYAMELYAALEEIEETGAEVDFPAWWQSKITVAKENMDGAKHYLEFELAEPAVDAFIDKATGEEPHMGEPEAPMMEAEISAEEKLAGKIAKALKDMANKDASDQHNLKQARTALNKGNIEAAKKIADPYLEEGLPKGFWDKKMKAKDETNESYETLVKKIKGQGESTKAAKAIAGAVAAYKAKGGGKGPTAKQSSHLKEEMSDEDMMYKYVSKYVKDSDDIDTEMENYKTSGYQALSEPVKASLRKDMDFITWVQMQHDEDQFNRERGL